MKTTQYITIKNAKIPVIIRNYKTSKYLKMYFKTETLYVSKPKYVSMKKAKYNCLRMYEHFMESVICTFGLCNQRSREKK